MKTVFFDVDTQIDFLFPAGALYVRNSEKIVPLLANLTQLAAANNIQIISSVDAHAEDDGEFKSWPPHCVIGTSGQQKLSATIFGKPVIISSTLGAFDRARDSALNSRQIVIEKQHLDCFTNPNLQPLLDTIRADRFVLYGVVSEICVRSAAFGLLKTGARVELVTDAIQAIDAEAERKFVSAFRGDGGVLTTTSAVGSSVLAPTYR